MPRTSRQVLITGASGFLGANLLRRLLAAGHTVHAVLRSKTTPARLAGLEGQFVAHCADLRDADAVRGAVAVCQPELVYHLAAHGTYPGQRDQAAILASNVLGTANLLDALGGIDYQAFVHAGSSSE